jgi:hypothetical protein
VAGGEKARCFSTLQNDANGTSRHFAATPDVGRFRTEADINRQARPAASVANDPHQTPASRLWPTVIADPLIAAFARSGSIADVLPLRQD